MSEIRLLNELIKVVVIEDTRYHFLMEKWFEYRKEEKCLTLCGEQRSKQLKRILTYKERGIC